MNSTMEIPELDADDVAAATFAATAQRCVGTDVVIIAVDGASLNPTERPWNRADGARGGASPGVRAIQVLTAVGMHPDGTPLGLLGQGWWIRTEIGASKQARDRDPEEKETWHWLTLLESVRELCYAYCSRPWFQLDQAGDAWLLLLAARYEDIYLTIRAAHNRRVVADHITEEPISLWPIVSREPSLGQVSLDLPAEPGQPLRTATVELRTRPVTVKAKNKKTNRVHLIDVFAVLAREVEPPAEGVEPLEWMLLTNRPTAGLDEACAVVLAYTYRWTSDTILKTWKAGAGLDPDTTLSFDGDSRTLALLLASLAVRAQRLLSMVYEDPDRPALDEFTADELNALISTRMRPDLHRDTITIAQAARWLAELGGTSTREAARSLDSFALSRGLELLEPLDSALQELRRS